MKYWDCVCPVCGHEMKLRKESAYNNVLVRTFNCNNCVKEIVITDKCSLKMKTLDDFGE